MKEYCEHYTLDCQAEKMGCEGCGYFKKSADEIWCIIKQNNNYEISNLGNVRNKKTKRILKPAISNKGYYLVSLCNKGKSHTYAIHKLVMEHFNRCAFEYEVVNHIDCNKLNNCIENLEYVTQKENIKKAWENNLCENVRAVALKKSKKILQFDKNGKFIKEYISAREAEILSNVSNGSILHCCKGKRKTAGGYIWKYKEN